MRLILLSILLFIIDTHKSIAQSSASESENYKHSHIIHQQNTTTFECDTVSLRNQKTHKNHTRKYIVAPSNPIPNRNVQGKKMKGNYKNQFN